MKGIFLIMVMSMSMVVEASSASELSRDVSRLEQEVAGQHLDVADETLPEEEKQRKWIKPLIVAGLVVVATAGGMIVFKKLHKGKKAMQTTADTSADEVASGGIEAGKNAESTKLAADTDGVEVKTKASEERIDELVPLMQEGRKLQAQAREGKQLSMKELDTIYQSRRAEIEVTEMTASEQTQRLQELDDTFFSLEDGAFISSIVKNLANGIPAANYSDEASEMISSTPLSQFAVELQVPLLFRVGNIREAIRRLKTSKRFSDHDQALILKSYLHILEEGIDVSKLDFGGSEFTARLKRITHDDFHNTTLPDHNIREGLADVYYYNRLQEYIEAAEAAAAQ